MSETSRVFIPAPADQPSLPAGYVASVPTSEDIPELHSLLSKQREQTRAGSADSLETLTERVTGTGSWTRNQVLIRTSAGELCAWAALHDRAAGRCSFELLVADAHEQLAPPLVRWIREGAQRIAATRGLPDTQVGVDLDERDQRTASWLAEAGFAKTRVFWEMARPVTEDDLNPPEPREGVRVRRIHTHSDGMPLARDVRNAHLVLEESFTDHFNSHRESLPEFMQRMRESPGHSFDLWWLAEVRDERGDWHPGGALVSAEVPESDGEGPAQYVAYLGVHSAARGRGVSKALMYAVLRDAAQRGDKRVLLEVDSESLTGANGLYESLGWRLDYSLHSWHAREDAADPVPLAKEQGN
ncbi:GNAT family N-acetyltransferase [Dermabacteraceae bacterium P13115]